jgi:hypothetical protein
MVQVKANVSVARISAEEERQMKALLMSQNKEREVNTQQLYAILAQGSSDAATAASKRVEKLEKELGRCKQTVLYVHVLIVGLWVRHMFVLLLVC